MGGAEGCGQAGLWREEIRGPQSLCWGHNRLAEPPQSTIQPKQRVTGTGREGVPVSCCPALVFRDQAAIGRIRLASQWCSDYPHSPEQEDKGPHGGSSWPYSLRVGAVVKEQGAPENRALAVLKHQEFG